MIQQFRPSDSERFEGALLGAALGDALGWPYEDRARRAASSPKHETLELEAWIKRSGGRFQPHEEAIEAGEYSDDTQLLIAVARSRVSVASWWRHLARVELPFWTIYQRGGGGATIRAARLLLKGVLPWESTGSDRQKYFEAGGNGVAMRIAPHALLGVRDNEFSSIARNVFADGVLTHGHPVALVGALAYAFAVWRAVRNRETLGYGQLLHEVANSFDVWGARPSIAEHWPTWAKSSSEVENYDQLWSEAVAQVRRQLLEAEGGMSTGALAFDEETLQRIGCFSKEIGGAGTVAASAAIFLSSKHAASPFEGVARAAFAKGADTDTIASMTGALVGAINGSDWLHPYRRRLQDTNYLSAVARQLCVGEVEDHTDVEKVTNADLTKLVNGLVKGNTEVLLPIHTRARVIGDGGVTAKSDGLTARSWRLVDERSQTFIIKKVRKNADFSASTTAAQQGLLFDPIENETPGAARVAGISLYAHDIEASKRFYSGLLGVPETGNGLNLVQFGGLLVLRANEHANAIGEGSIVYIEVKDIRRCHRFLQKHAESKASDLETKSGRLAFSCLDPDGRIVEVFQS